MNVSDYVDFILIQYQKTTPCRLSSLRDTCLVCDVANCVPGARYKKLSGDKMHLCFVFLTTDYYQETILEIYFEQEELKMNLVPGLAMIQCVYDVTHKCN